MSATAEKALRVLEALSTHSAPVRLADLSRELNINKSTTYRLLEKMGQLGYVRQDETNGRYMMTARMWEIGVRAFQGFDARAWARPYLERIEREVQETSVLAILEMRDVIIVDKRDSTQAVQTFSPLGSRTPLHCSSLGKAFLMADPELIGRLKRPLQRFTEHTVTSVRQLRNEIAKAQQEQVATAFNEFSDGVSGVAAPALDANSNARAVIGVTLPSMRAEGAHLELAKSVVRQNAYELSRALGYSGSAPIEQPPAKAAKTLLSTPGR